MRPKARLGGVILQSGPKMVIFVYISVCREFQADLDAINYNKQTSYDVLTFFKFWSTLVDLLVNKSTCFVLRRLQNRAKIAENVCKNGVFSYDSVRREFYIDLGAINCNIGRSYDVLTFFKFQSTLVDLLVNKSMRLMLRCPENGTQIS